MNKKMLASILVVVLLLCASASVIYARDIGNWTKTLTAYQSWAGDTSRTKYHVNEKAVFNTTNPDSYVYWYGTTTASDVKMCSYEDYVNSIYGAGLGNNYYHVQGNNERNLLTWVGVYYQMPDIVRLHMYNYHASSIITKGTWSPDES